MPVPPPGPAGPPPLAGDSPRSQIMCESHTSLATAAQTTAGRHAPRTGGSSDFVPWAPALAERGPQDVLGGIGGRARGDRVDVGAVQLTEVDAVEGNPGVVAREFQLPGRLADVHLTGAHLRDAHDASPSLPGPLSRVLPVCTSRFPAWPRACNDRQPYP